MQFQMLQYKRNQIEEAISGVLEPRSLEPTSELRTRLKRLLETDRTVASGIENLPGARALRPPS